MVCRIRRSLGGVICFVRCYFCVLLYDRCWPSVLLCFFNLSCRPGSVNVCSSRGYLPTLPPSCFRPPLDTCLLFVPTPLRFLTKIDCDLGFCVHMLCLGIHCGWHCIAKSPCSNHAAVYRWPVVCELVSLKGGVATDTGCAGCRWVETSAYYSNWKNSLV